MVTNFLFIYGTLLNSGNEFAVYLQKNSKPYSTGKFKGRLYDIGEYPGAVEDKSDSYVYGRVVCLNAPAVLNDLDVYEGYDPKQSKSNLFIRKITTVETKKGLVDCWVYLYNLPINDLWKITSGNYLKYKKR